MSDRPWPFSVPENTTAFALQDILEKKAPILLVFHDAEGDWQFLDGREDPDAYGAVVGCLRHFYDLDPSIGELADLPPGWQAWREAPDQPWQREETPDEEEGEEEEASEGE